MRVSVVIRTFNEARYLGELLTAVERQETPAMDVEVVLVDSGSDDATLSIAAAHGCRILHISRAEFSFGRALNLGCEAATGEILVAISGHCVPVHRDWLDLLCRPLRDGIASYSYGRQIGSLNSQFSERRIFAKYYPEHSQIPQPHFFCNNANSAITRAAWAAHRFDEDLTGLEDMELAQRLVAAGNGIAYVAEAVVYHHHHETWYAVKRRFEREAIALQRIMPQIHLRKRDLVRYIFASVWLDFAAARSERALLRHAPRIIRYRFWQYWGSFVGNHNHRKLSHADKEAYFFPQRRPPTSRWIHEPARGRSTADEGQQ